MGEFPPRQRIYMKQSSKSLLLCVIILILIIIFYAWLLKARVSTGVLYMVGDDNPVCAGTLSTYHRPYGATESNFVCTDGRKFNNLTNFYLKEE
jgi:hypothetical protein